MQNTSHGVFSFQLHLLMGNVLSHALRVLGSVKKNKVQPPVTILLLFPDQVSDGWLQPGSLIPAPMLPAGFIVVLVIGFGLPEVATAAAVTWGW